MSEILDYARMFARFPASLARFLRAPLTRDESLRIVRERMGRREANFLRLVERSVYGNARSPYLALLRSVGCEFGDVRNSVARHGLEGALAQLRQAGVYATYEEFKGRKPIVRNGLTLRVSARDFDNPFARTDFTLSTGGSTGLATSVGQDLDYIAAGAPHQVLALTAHGAIDAPTVQWMNMLPGNGLRFIIQRAHYGARTLAWYSALGWRDSVAWPKYDLATVYMVSWMKALGASAPYPRIARMDEPITVARHVHRVLREHGRCLLYTSTSRAMRVCLAAEEAGLDLSGALVRVGGEPITPVKVDVMRRVGVRHLAAYGMTEVGGIAFGCVRPDGADDMHFYHDMFAVITHPVAIAGAGVTVPAINLTSLVDSTPKVMLNYETDDYGIVERRACGCELEALGFTTHMREVRSYGKLVGESVTLVGSEMLRVLETALPARFGGSMLDYQLREQEDGQGFTRLQLVIHPRLKIDDERAVVGALLDGLRASSAMADAARAIWQQTDTIRVVREVPAVSASGKVLPLHILRSDGKTRKTTGEP